MDNESIDLTQFDEAYRSEVPEERGDYEDVPDGKYQVTIEKVELTKAQSTGNAMIKYALRIIGPEYINRVLYRNSVITPNTLRYIKTDLHLCGLDLENLSDLSMHLEMLLDLQLNISKKTKGENVNIFFNGRIASGKAPGNSGQSAGDAAVPF